MNLKDAIVKRVLDTDEGKKALTSAVSQAVMGARLDMANEAAKVIKDVKLNAIAKQKYYVSSFGKTGTIDAKDVPSGKVFSTLDTLFSNSPGSVQCADRIADSIIGGGYVLEKTKGERATEKDKKRLLKFFDNPNSDGETIDDIVRNGITNILRYGDWFIEKVPPKVRREGQQQIAEIYNLDPAQMSILVDEELHKKGVDTVLGYKRTTGYGSKVIYEKGDITHIKRTSPDAGMYGEPVLFRNTSILLLIIQALNYNMSILKNGGFTPLQLNLPDGTNEADAEAALIFWETNFAGAFNAGKPLITFNGAKAEKLGMDPNDMRYMDLLEYGQRSVAGMYGVPLILIGIPDGTNRATASASVKAFYLNKVYPLRKYIAQKITNEIIRKGFGIEGWSFDFRTSGLEESDATRRDVMLGFSKGLYSFNETRIKLGLIPLPYAWADGYYLVGSKNDMLIDIEQAIENGSLPISAQPADTTPNNPPAPRTAEKPNGTQGEGADGNDN